MFLLFRGKLHRHAPNHGMHRTLGDPLEVGSGALLVGQCDPQAVNLLHAPMHTDMRRRFRRVEALPSVLVGKQHGQTQTGRVARHYLRMVRLFCGHVAEKHRQHGIALHLHGLGQFRVTQRSLALHRERMGAEDLD